MSNPVGSSPSKCARASVRSRLGRAAQCAGSWLSNTARSFWLRTGLDKFSGLLVFVFAIGGFLAGLVIVGLATDENGSKFTLTPQFRVWSAIAGALVALAVVVFLYSGAILLSLRSKFGKPGGLVRLSVLYCVFSGLIFWVTIIFGSPDTSRVADYSAPRAAFLVLGLVASAPSIIGIWLIGLALMSMKGRIFQLRRASQEQSGGLASDDVRMPKQVLSDLMLARIKLLALLSSVGSLVGVTVLATGALRNALLAARTTDGRAVEYPIEYVLIYGLFFSALLAIVYAPVISVSRIHRETTLSSFSRCPLKGTILVTATLTATTLGNCCTSTPAFRKHFRLD
jgi:hypothetical protein